MTALNDRIRAEVVACAIRNIGYGETTRNNDGPFIDAIGGNRSKDPEWCALFAGHCYRVARFKAGLLFHVPEADWLYRDRNHLVAEPGALRLFNGLAKVGVRYGRDDAEESWRFGDLILWKRTGGHHIGVVEFVDDGLVHTIEGNVGRFPAKVKRLVHDISKEPHFVGFAGLSR